VSAMTVDMRPRRRLAEPRYAYLVPLKIDAPVVQLFVARCTDLGTRADKTAGGQQFVDIRAPGRIEECRTIAEVATEFRFVCRS